MTARIHRTCFVIATIFVVLNTPFASAQKLSGGPVLSSAETTADGYILVGSGFGRDASLVKIFEGKIELPPSAVIAVSGDRITVRSRSRGLIEHAVMVDGQKTAVLAVTHAEPTSLASLSMTPTSVEGGEPATLTIALGRPAPSGGATIALSVAGGSGATLPANATVPAGQNNTTVKIDTSAVSATTRLQISAAYAGAKKAVQLEVRPKPADVALQSLAISPAVVQSGESTTATITLTAPAPPGGATLSITSSAAEVTVPATVTVPQASTTKTFSVQAASGLSVNVASTIRATLGSETPKPAQVIVTPASLGVSAITLNPASVQGGRQVTGMVTISAAAPQGGTIVTVTSSHAEARPSTALVMPGLTSAAFNIATDNPASTVNATISAKIGSGTAKTAQLTVVATPVEIASVTLSPATVERGVGTVVSVDLTAAAPAGGVTLNLSSSNPDAPLSSTTTVGVGASRATVAFRTNETATPGTATITAALGSGSSRSATLTITGPPEQPIHVGTITVSPANVPAGEAPLVTVTLSRAAPTGGTQVNLVSAVPGIASIGPSLTVAPGATSAQTRVYTQAVAGMASTVNVALAAAVGTTGSRQTTLTVQAPASVALTSLTLSPATVVSGGTATVTVALAGAAPEGGVLVALTSTVTSLGNRPGSTVAITVPASVRVSAGLTSAQFTVPVGDALGDYKTTIMASAAGVSKSAELGIESFKPTSITVTAREIAYGQSSTGTVTFNAPAPQNATIRIQPMNDIASSPGELPAPAGARSMNFSFQAKPCTANCTLWDGTRYFATFYTANGTPNGLGAYGAQTDMFTICGSSATLTFPQAQGYSGQRVAGTVTTGTVLTSGQVLCRLPASGPVSLSLREHKVSPSDTATVPRFFPNPVVIQQGATTANFEIELPETIAERRPMIAADIGSTPASSAYVTIKPNHVAGVQLSPSTVSGGGSGTGTVTLYANALTGGAKVALSSGSTAVTLPAEITVPAGSSSVQFGFQVLSVDQARTVQITARRKYGNQSSYEPPSVQAALNLQPGQGSTARVTKVEVSSPTLQSGTPTPGFVELDQTAPSEGLQVTLERRGACCLELPGSVSVPAGQTRGNFTAGSRQQNDDSQPIIRASLQSSNAETTVTLLGTHLASFDLPAEVRSGTSLTFPLRVKPAPASTLRYSATSNDTVGFPIPSTIEVPAGTQEINVTVDVPETPVAKNVTVRLTRAGEALDRTFTIRILQP